MNALIALIEVLCFMILSLPVLLPIVWVIYHTKRGRKFFDLDEGSDDHEL